MSLVRHSVTDEWMNEWMNEYLFVLYRTARIRSRAVKCLHSNYPGHSAAYENECKCPPEASFLSGGGGGGVANTVNGQRSQNHHCSADSGDAVQQSGRLSFLQLLTICHCPVWSILNCQHENAFKRRSKAAWPSQSCSLTQNPHAVIYVSSSSVIFCRRWRKLNLASII